MGGKLRKEKNKHEQEANTISKHELFNNHNPDPNTDPDPNPTVGVTCPALNVERLVSLKCFDA